MTLSSEPLKERFPEAANCSALRNRWVFWKQLELEVATWANNTKEIFMITYYVYLLFKVESTLC